MKERLLFWTPPVIALGVVIAVFALPRELKRPRPEEALKDPNPAVRADALRRGVSESLVIEALKDEDADVRIVAASRLSGPKRMEAVFVMLKDDHGAVRTKAMWSLAFMGEKAWPAIEEALKDENPRVRSGAALAIPKAWVLKEDGEWHRRQRETFLPALRPLLTDDDPEVRSSAEEVMKYLSR